MKKFEVAIRLIVVADNRQEAWIEARKICQKRLRDLAWVESIAIEPLLIPESYIAVNEPIKAAR